MVNVANAPYVAGLFGAYILGCMMDAQSYA
jgi:hypothetical protein